MASSVERTLKIAQVPQGALKAWTVLDVGAGTGFWIDFWLAKQAQRIVGIDLTSASVQHLMSQYPQLEFEQRNIADPVDDSQHDVYDIISAMSVLHHIPSQSQWEQALINLGCMLKPGGYVLIMDPILRYRWWGAPFDEGSTGRPRTVAEHVTIMARSGVRLKVLAPTVVLLANPVDTKWRLEFRLLDYWWRLFTRIARRERLMQSGGWLVYAFDRILCRLNYMPSSKVMLFQKDNPR